VSGGDPAGVGTGTQRAPPLAEALHGVKVVFVRAGERPPEDAWRFSVRWLEPRPRSAALGFLDAPAAFRGPAVREDAPVVALHVKPSLDDVVALGMWAWERAGRGRAAGRAWQALAHYGDNVRQGFVPESVPPTRAPQALFRAIAQEHLRGDRRGFVAPALALVELLVRKVEAGRSLLTDDLAVDERGGVEPFLVEYLQIVATDRQRYEQDLARAERYEARIPPEGAGGVETVLPLLAIASPRATLFRIWAQRDERAPGGAGYPLLLTFRPTTPPGLADVQISASPGACVTLSFLAPALTAAEREVVGPEVVPWYPGADYQDRMIASPDEGTRLSFAQVVAAVRGPLALKADAPAPERGEGAAGERRGGGERRGDGDRERLQPRLRTAWAISLAVAALFTGLAIGYRLVRPRPVAAASAADDGAGTPAGERGQQRVVTPDAQQAADEARRREQAREEAFRARRDRALVFATDRYADPAWPDLQYPVKQATAIARALRRRGFDVTLRKNPTYRQVIEDLEGSTAKARWNPYDQLLVYFAGHGAVFRQLGTGRLVFADSQGDDTRCLSLPDLHQMLVEHPAQHVLLVLDSCYAGTFKFDAHRDLGGREARTRGRDGVDEDAARELLAAPARRYLAAVGRTVTPDRSRFSARLLALLQDASPLYLTDQAIAAELQAVKPVPRHGAFEGDEDAAAFVFAPAAVGTASAPAAKVATAPAAKAPGAPAASAATAPAAKAPGASAPRQPSPTPEERRTASAR
jgi:hypothetical protein